MIYIPTFVADKGKMERCQRELGAVYRLISSTKR